MTMISALHLPREIEVATREWGEPATVKLSRTSKKVISIWNTWRIDEEWWREEISRQYYRVQLEDGSVETIFQDLLSGKWYRQRC